MKTFDVIGETLLTLGALLGLFIVWQLFYTDIQSEREQQEVAETFTSSDTYIAPEPTKVGEKHYDNVPEIDMPGHGEVFATMRVPRWGADYNVPVAEGSGLDVINRVGIGHYDTTAPLGAEGNFSVAAHRTTYGKPFREVHELEDSDAIIYETDDAWLVYRVARAHIVNPNQSEVIAPVPPVDGAQEGERWTTLTTCHPIWGMSERFIVHAEFDYWTPKHEGIAPDLVGVL